MGRIDRDRMEAGLLHSVFLSPQILVDVATGRQQELQSIAKHAEVCRFCVCVWVARVFKGP